MVAQEYKKYIKAEKEIIYADVSLRLVELLNAYGKLVIALETNVGIQNSISEFKAKAEALLAYIYLLDSDFAEKAWKQLDEMNEQTAKSIARELVKNIVKKTNTIIKIVKKEETAVGI